MPYLRLDKLLSDMGLASRKDGKELIRQGRVTVDGRAEKRPECKVDPEQSVVAVDGETIRYAAHHYYMMDKPCGVLTASEDRQQKTVLELVTPQMRRLGLFPVGRLDKDTSGLLLLTDDGEFAHRVISPKSCVEKLYYAKVDGVPDESDMAAFAEGLILADGTRCRPAGMQLLGGSACLVTVTEGKYHQVKRMLASRGKPVLELRRLAIGGLALEDTLGPGGFRELTEQDLCKLFRDQYQEK